METLLLGDAVYVHDRFQELEVESRRRSQRGCDRSHLSDDERRSPTREDASHESDFLSSLSPHTSLDKKIAVIAASLQQLEALCIDQLQAASCVGGSDEVVPPEQAQGSLHSESKLGVAMNAEDPVASSDSQKLSAGSQLGLKLFFRLCENLRSHEQASHSLRAVSLVASKIPGILSSLPPYPTSSLKTPDEMSTSANGSVFTELASLFGRLLGLDEGGGGMAREDSTDPTSRAQFATAYLALGLKWGRLREIVQALMILMKFPGLLERPHVALLHMLLKSLQVYQPEPLVESLPAPEIKSSGFLLSFGKGDHGKLGHGQCTHAACAEGNCTENKAIPTAVASTRGVKFIKIDSLSTHSIAVTSKGEVMAWGNGDKYRLGHGTASKEYAPRVIEALSVKGKVSDVACGLGHTLALMSSGVIYAWGNGSNGRLGLGDANDRSTPTEVSMSSDSVARSSARRDIGAPVFRFVICGASHSLALTTDGRVFTWGKNNQGQCGHGHTNDQLQPAEIAAFRDELNERVVDAAGGWEHTLYCSATGKVYSSGCGYKDSRRAGIPPVLGHGDNDKRLKPTVVQALTDVGEEMIRVACGWDHSLAISSQGALYTWGSGTNGKLGHGDEENCDIPTLVRGLSGKIVKDAKAGCEHTVVLTDSHELWAFGQGDSGRLGLGDTASRKVPTKVDIVAHCGLQPVAIAVGDKYNLILAEELDEKGRGGDGQYSPSRTRHDNSLHTRHQDGSVHRKTHSTQAALRRREHLSRGQTSGSCVGLEQQIGIESPLPATQDELISFLSQQLIRIASVYLLSSDHEGDVRVSSRGALPYTVDVASTTLQHILDLLRLCEDDDQQVRQQHTLKIACLRLLTINIIHCRSLDAKTLASTTWINLFRQIYEAIRATSSQNETSNGPEGTPSDIEEECAVVLKHGFRYFFPMGNDRSDLLWELLAKRSALRHCDSVLFAQLCEDSAMSQVVASYFRQSTIHRCVASSSVLPLVEGGHSAMKPLPEDGHRAGHLIQKMVGSLEDLSAREHQDHALQALGILQANLFAVVNSSAKELRRSQNQFDENVVCDCSLDGLLVYLGALFDNAYMLVKNLHDQARQSVVSTNSTGFHGLLPQVLLPAVHLLLASIVASDAAEEGFIAKVNHTILRRAQSILTLLDEIVWKMSESAQIDTGTSQDVQVVPLIELGEAFAMLCSRLIANESNPRDQDRHQDRLWRHLRDVWEGVDVEVERFGTHENQEGEHLTVTDLQGIQEKLLRWRAPVKSSVETISASKMAIGSGGYLVILMYSGVGVDVIKKAGEVSIPKHVEELLLCFFSQLKHVRDDQISIQSALGRLNLLIKVGAPAKPVPQDTNFERNQWVTVLTQFLVLPAVPSGFSSLDTKLRGHIAWLDQAVNGLAASVELLEQVNSPILKRVLLNELLRILLRLGSALSPMTRTAAKRLHTSLGPLLAEATTIIRDPLQPALERAKALQFWLWAVGCKSVARSELVQLVATTGIVQVLSDILLLEPQMIGLPVPESEIGAFTQRRMFYKATPQTSLRLRPVEALLDSGHSQSILREVAHEVFAGIAQLLCQHDTASAPHPLVLTSHKLSANEPREPRATSAVRPGSSSPRRRYTLPRRAEASTVSDSTTMVFETLVMLLQRQVECHDELRRSLSPLRLSRGQGTAAFLLASPLAFSASKSHVVKPMKLVSSSAICTTNSTPRIGSVSGWLFIDSGPQPTSDRSTRSTVSSLFAIGSLGERTEDTGAAGTASLLLSPSDRLKLVVFAVLEPGLVNQCRLGFSIASGGDNITESMASFVCERTHERGHWLHLLICLGNSTEPLLFINGTQVSCHRDGSWTGLQFCSNSSLPESQSPITSIDSHSQLLCGGTLDNLLLHAMGFASPDQSSDGGCVVATSQCDVLIDDVWALEEYEPSLAVQLHAQGPTFSQIKREFHTAVQSSRSVGLLSTLLEVKPLHGDNDGGRSESLERITDVLLRLLQHQVDAMDCDPARSTVQILTQITRSMRSPKATIVDRLMQFVSARTGSSSLLRQELLRLFVFSSRVGVQSSSVASPQASIVQLLANRGIADTSAAVQVQSDEADRCHSVIQTSVASLLRQLCSAPDWRSIIVKRMGESVERISRVSAQACDVVSAEDSSMLSILNWPGRTTQLQPITRSKNLLQDTADCPLLQSGESLRALWSLGQSFTDPTIVLGATRTSGDADRQVMKVVEAQVAALACLLESLHRPDPTQDQAQDLWSEDRLRELLRKSAISIIDILHQRFGANEAQACRLASVQALCDSFLRPVLSGSSAIAISLQDEVEPLAMSMRSKYERQHLTARRGGEAPISWRLKRSTRSPLETVGGDVRIIGWTIHALQHFPTVRLGRVVITASSGLWYYEVLVSTDGLMQIGYVDSDFTADPVQGQGVGDHTNSWAFDGFRRKKWNVSSADYGESWRAGDIVGVLLDTDRGELSYFLNGKFLGVAFSSMPLTATSVMHPAVSLNADQRIRFNIGVRDDAAVVVIEEVQHDPYAVWRLQLPALHSPLDQQRLQAVVCAMDDDGLATDRPGDRAMSFGVGDEDEVDGGNVVEDLEAAEFEPKSSPYLRGQSHGDRGRDMTSLVMPGSIHDEIDSISSTGFREMAIREGTLRVPRPSSRGDGEDSDGDDSQEDDESTRETELLHGLIALGFPRAWAIRCATETSFTVNDSGAVSWILEQMEREVTSAAGPYGDVDQASLPSASFEAQGEHGGVPRATQDDLSLMQSRNGGGGGGRRLWQLSLSPTRPQSEQYTRAPVFQSHLSPTKARHHSSEGSTEARSSPSNPFLSSSFDDDENETDIEAISLVETVSASLSMSYAGGERRALHQKWSGSHAAPSNAIADYSSRVSSAAGDEDDLLPALVTVYSLLNVSYARTLAVELLLNPHRDLAKVYPVVAATDYQDFFKLLRCQLRLNVAELPVATSRLSATVQTQQIAAAVTRLLQLELHKGQGNGAISLADSIRSEVHSQVSKALRVVKARTTRSLTRAIKEGMDSRWTLWLFAAWHEAIDMDANRTTIDGMLTSGFVGDVIALAASSAAADAPWRMAAFGIIRMLLSLDARAAKAPRIPVRFFVELLARRLQAEQTNSVAHSELTSQLWRITLEHLPHQQRTSQALANELERRGYVRVEHISSTRVSISWEVEDNESTQSDEDGSRTLSLSVVADGASDGTVGPSANAWMGSDTPHSLPLRGVHVVRRLAPDSSYTIQLLKSRSITQGGGISPQPAIVQQLRVRTPPEPVFELDSEACGGNLVLLQRNRAAKNQVNKKWNTVRATVAFEEGIHHWHIRIDNCVSKNIFIGVATEDASLDNYIGSDAYGYGFLANKAVWHNKSKIQSYGEIYKQGDLLQVTLDCDARTLSFSRNGEPLGIAASNLHVSGSHEDVGISAPCKWYPAVSLYNKDDQVTLIVPPSADMAMHRPVSQCASVQSLVSSSRFVLSRAMASQEEGFSGNEETWTKWKAAQVCWRELPGGQVIKIDAVRESTVELFGLAPGDTLFTSRGHCVVLGVHNHELWYEVSESVGDLRPTKTGSWSLHTCRAMLSTPDEYPIHRRRLNAHVDPWTEAFGSDLTLNFSDLENTQPDKDQTLHSVIGPRLDAAVVQLIDAIAAQRGLSSPYQLTYADCASAISLHSIMDKLQPGFSSIEQVLRCISYLIGLNRHVVRVARLFLSQTVSPSWEQVLASLHELESSESGLCSSPPLVAATRLASAVTSGILHAEFQFSDGKEAKSVNSEQVLDFIRSHLFSSQRDRLIADAMRRTVTPKDAVALDLKSEDAVNPPEQPRTLAKITISSQPKTTCPPFWESAPVLQTKEPRGLFSVPDSEDRRARSLFVQLSTQLRNLPSQELRREVVSASDPLLVSRTFDVALATDSPTDPVDSTTMYLKLLDEVFIELQSPAFPLFVPIESDDSIFAKLALDVNAQLLLPEASSHCGVCHDQVKLWYFHVGQLLGIAWRAKLTLPLQFISPAFWEDLVRSASSTSFHSSALSNDNSRESRLRIARAVAIEAVRDGLYTVVPCTCLLVSSPESLRRQLSEDDMFAVDKLHRHAVYDRDSPHHSMLWHVVHSFSSLERRVFSQYIRVRSSSWPESTAESPIDQWKRRIESPASKTLEIFVLHVVEPLPDAVDHPDACFPVVEVVDPLTSRLHLPAYSSVDILRLKLRLAMASVPSP